MQYLRKIAGVIAATGLALLGLAGTAYATDDAAATQPSAGLAPGDTCGFATYTLVNPSAWPQTFDYRTANEPAVAPVEAELDGVTIAEGPLAGQPFGPTWHQVTVAPGETITNEFAFTEDYDGGTTTLQARLVRGPEQLLFFDWVSLDVVTDCIPDEPPAEPAGSFDATAVCEGDTLGYTASLHNPTAADVTFSLDTVVGDDTTSTDVVVPAGQDATAAMPAGEDMETTLRIRVGDTVLTESTVTLDCVDDGTPPPATDDPADDTPPATDDPAVTDPPATTPAPVLAGDNGGIGGGSNGGQLDTASADKLAYTNGTGNVPWLIAGGAAALAGGVALVVVSRRRLANRQ